MEISNLRFSDANNSGIDMIVTIADGVTIPFTYREGDLAPVSVAVAELLAAGNYAIAGYVPPEPSAP
jgi:hypothetical protein